MARLPVYQRILEELLRVGHDDGLLGPAGRARPGQRGQGAQGPLAARAPSGPGAPATTWRSSSSQIDRQLGLDRDWPVVVVGIGTWVGRWPAPRGSLARGFRVGALFDTDPAIIGERVGGVVVRHPTTGWPNWRPGATGDRGDHHPGRGRPGRRRPLVAIGVTSILNFSPRVLVVPAGVLLRYVDLEHRAPGHELLPVPTAETRPGMPASASGPRADGPAALPLGLSPVSEPASPRAIAYAAGEPARRPEARPAPSAPERAGEPLSVVVVGLEHRHAPLDLLERVTRHRDDLGQGPRATCATRPTCPRRWCCPPACAPRSTPWSSGSTTPSRRSRRARAGVPGRARRRSSPTAPSASTTTSPSTSSRWPPGSTRPSLGESEVLGQVRRAWERAQGSGVGAGPRRPVPPRRARPASGSAPRRPSPAGITSFVPRGGGAGRDATARRPGRGPAVVWSAPGRWGRAWPRRSPRCPSTGARPRSSWPTGRPSGPTRWRPDSAAGGWPVAEAGPRRCPRCRRTSCWRPSRPTGTSSTAARARGAAGDGPTTPARRRPRGAPQRGARGRRCPTA